MQARWYQAGAIQSLFEFVQAKGTRDQAPLIALPTGTGKGYVVGDFTRQVMSRAPRTRVMMATHVKELISQNAAKLLEIWPLAPLGIYSAGLKSRDMGMPITFCGVQSVYKKAELFGWIDILIIDEAHLLSPKSASMYQVLIAKLRAMNPDIFIVGLTATAYRMGQGSLTDGDGIFTDICYDMTDIKGFNQLVAEGFLCPLYPKKTNTTFDVSKVGISNGEFNKGELEKAVDKDTLTRACLAELVHFGADRDCWMIFASGIHHSERIAAILRDEFGVSAGAIHSGNSDDENNAFISAFKSGQMRCAVNMNKLTTGFDHPPIDLIGGMRPTQSPGLHVQMLGRGTRPSHDTGKRDTLVLDFAGNTRRLGPINDPKIPTKSGGGGGDAPVRICEQCGIYCPASARICYCCGYEFTFQEKLLSTASTDELIRSDAPIIETFPVKRVLYGRHQKKITNPDGSITLRPPCMRVTYLVGMTPYTEWVFLDSDPKSLAAKKSRDWWHQRHAYEPPNPSNCAPFPSATDAALSIASQLKVPKSIRVWTNRPQPEVQSVEY